MFRYLVTFAGTNRLVTVERKLDFESKCRTVFGIGQGSSIKTEFFFEEFDDFAEITDVPNELPDNGKLRLTVSDFAIVVHREESHDVVHIIGDDERSSTSDTLTPSEAEAAVGRSVLLQSAGGPESDAGGASSSSTGPRQRTGVGKSAAGDLANHPSTSDTLTPSEAEAAVGRSVLLQSAGGPESDAGGASSSSTGPRQRTGVGKSAAGDLANHPSTSDTLTPSEAEAAVGRSVLLQSAGGPESDAGGASSSSTGPRQWTGVGKSAAGDLANHPSVLRIDRLTRSTREKLLSGQSLGRSDWSDVTRAVFEDCVAKQDSYPSNYLPMAKDMLKAYPNLIQDLTEEKATELLALRLKNKFKNGRKRSTSPTVFDHQKGKKLKQAPAMSGYQPPVNNSAIDDQKSINLMKSPEVGEETVKKLMASTFPVRRQDVIKGASVAKLKKLYPHLFTPEQLWLEMARITGRDGIRDEAIESLNSWKEILQKHTGCQQGQEIENLERIMFESTEEDAGKHHPSTRRDGSDMVLIVEGQEIVRLRETDESLLLWQCAFWIFNLKTPKSQSNLNWFLRTKVFGNLSVERTPSPKAAEAVGRMLS